VVHGYVGNRCAVFALQLNGIETDFVNSVHFSNHTGYGAFAGQVLSGEDLDVVTSGLRASGLLSTYSHVLTGYIGSESFLARVVGLVDECREASESAEGETEVEWVCDPVLGDNGRYYVPKELVGLYKRDVLPRATVLTPNQFEAELLSGRSIRTTDDALAAMDTIHAAGCSTVVMTSSDLPTGDGADTMLMLCSCPWEDAEASAALWGSAWRAGGSDFARFAVVIPRIEGSFTGTGDLTASLILAGRQRLGPGRMPAVCERAVQVLQTVCNSTADWAASPAGAASRVRAEAAVASAVAADSQSKARVPPPELRLVQCAASIREPPACEGVRLAPVIAGAVMLQTAA
jgi:pyridoxine kinase